MCSAQYCCFLYFLDVVLSRHVASVATVITVIAVLFTVYVSCVSSIKFLYYLFSYSFIHFDVTAV